MSVQAFAGFIKNLATAGQTIGREIAQKLDVPYYEDREVDAVWEPDSYNSVEEAVRKLPHGITGTYFHRRSMNLVLLGPLDEKVGIRSTSFLSGVEPLKTLKKHEGFDS